MEITSTMSERNLCRVCGHRLGAKASKKGKTICGPCIDKEVMPSPDGFQPWTDGDYEKEHYYVFKARGSNKGKVFVCWPNAGRMHVVDGGTGQINPGPDVYIRKMTEQEETDWHSRKADEYYARKLLTP